MTIFHTLTIIIAAIVFLGLFIYTLIVAYSNKSTTFPKDMTLCPDFWTVNPDGTCQIPTPAPNKTALNVGKLSDSQHTTYPIYTYPTSRPDATGAKLDTLLRTSNVSFLPAYDDPGTVLRGTPQKPSFPIDRVRNGRLQSGKPSEAKVFRYDIQNDIPYGYSIRHPGAIDFRDRGWASHGDPYCAIQSWTKQNGIAWDGMLAYNKC